MKVREALIELGVEKVKRGTESFNYARNASFSTCFCGFAYGAMGQLTEHLIHIRSYTGMGEEVFTEVARALEISEEAALVLSHAYEADTINFKSEVMLFLAEHGEAVESSVEQKDVIVA